MRRLYLILCVLFACALASQAQGTVSPQRVHPTNLNPPTSCVPAHLYTNATVGKAWEGKSDNTCIPVATGAATDAPADATYITQTPDPTLSAEQALSALATGILKSTTTTGVLSIAVAGDFPTLNQNTSGTAANLSGTPALPNGTTATTQSQADGSPKLATNAYVDTGLAGKTNASVVPNTAPSAGQVPVGNAGGTAYAPVSLNQDCTMTSAGVVTCLKTNNVSFGTLATQNGTFSGTSSGTNTGDQTITLTGAVTGSGTGSFATTIATPGTLTVSTTNSTATAHTHAITSSNAPGAAASLLATDSSGIIGSTGTRIVKGWFTDLTVTNSISGSITGNAATVTTNANLTGDVTSSGNATTIANNAVTLAKLATQATNTVVGNATSGTASPTALAVGSCSAAGSALQWTTNSGFGCNTNITANTASTATTLIGTWTGTTTNDDAASGKVGEYLSCTGSSTALTTATGKSLCNIPLTAGDWDVTGPVYFSPAASTIVARTAGSVSTTNNTMDFTNGKFQQNAFSSVALSNDEGITIPRVRITIASSTTIYLVAYADFTVSTMNAYGSMNARRVR